MRALLIFFLLFPLFAAAGDFDGVYLLAKRRVPWLADKLELEETTGAGNNYFDLSMHGGSIHIRADNAVNAAAGLGWYLKYYCHRSMSHTGDNLTEVSPLPQIEGIVKKESFVKYRYALNYCTYNYTMSFYDWKQWERELDWMALHGVNLMITAIGVEGVWQQVMRHIGFSDSEIAAFIPGPCYTAWWLMGNLEGWGGRMPQAQIDGRIRLQQQVLARMKELDIEPVFPAFYGVVPNAMKHKTRAHITQQGNWCGFERPAFLNPTDTAFTRIAQIYYREVKRLYGNNIRYFSGDPFHEGGDTRGISLAKAGAAIQKQMQAAFPHATWVLQAWGDNPNAAMLEKVDKKHVLIQELAGENSDNWYKRKGFEKTPFIWCSINNFGERTGMHGKLQRFADEVYRATNNPYSEYMQGVGIMAEGIHNNAVAYDLILELAWRHGHVDVSQWLKGYALYRYGTDDPHIQQAWQGLLQTAYNSDTANKESLPENIICARPDTGIVTVSTWGRIDKGYDTRLFENAVKQYLQASAAVRQTETYKYDRTDMLRQVLSSKALSIYAHIMQAYRQKNLTAFKRHTAEFLQTMQLTNDVLATHPSFRLSTWQRAALNVPQQEVMQNNLHNALMLITYWGGSTKESDILHEYAYKEWAGLITGFYMPRWKLYFDYLQSNLSGIPAVRPDFFSYDRDWVEHHYLHIADDANKEKMERYIPMVFE